MKRYYAKQYARNRWIVIGPDGMPLYDGAPFGKDRELIFRDEDAVMDYVERRNVFDDSETEIIP